MTIDQLDREEQLVKEGAFTGIDRRSHGAGPVEQPCSDVTQQFEEVAAELAWPSRCM